MRSVRHLLSVALLVLSAVGAAAAQDGPVVVDGRFGEWEGVAPAVVDPADAPAPYADLRRVQARFDAEGTYLALEFEREVTLQGLPGTLALLLTWTPGGWDAHGVEGVSAAVEFSPAWEPGAAPAGIGVRMMDSAGGPPLLTTANHAGIVVAPTHAARRFELRIPRGGLLPVDGPMTARIVALDADGRVVDEAGAFVLDPGRRDHPRPTPPGHGAADPLARAPGTDFRVVSWNVGREDLFREPDAFGALLRPLAPDLLMLDEVEGGHSAAEVEALLDRILPGDRPWRAVYGVSGGPQRGVIATRGSAPRIVAPFTDVLPYPDSARVVIPANAAEDARAWLQSRMESHVPATGAIAEVAGRRILAVAVDLESGGTAGSAKDRLRDTEADAIRDATEAALMANVREEQLNGLLIAGDLNLVGSVAPLEVLLRPVTDGPPLAVALPLRLDGASAATWENPEEPFTPGRLDYVLYHPAFMAVTGGFVFRVADLSPAWLARHGLDADASRVTDHLPVVTDLRWVDRPR
ncbi:MAG TPA: endonuclease/exonuclease/phosphatase family protein [Longimicrobium sp.]|nr:endonuclease/exonuclease/phosphatase family protein [Longimicrobium sp.]